MKNIGIILLLSFLASCSNKKENSYIKYYYQNVYLAEEAYYQKDYQKVFDLMTEATDKCNLINQRGIYEMLKYAEAAARIEEDAKAIELVEKLILNSYDINKLTHNEAFFKLAETDEWKALSKKYEKYNQQYLKSINLELREEIKTMGTNDQYYRNLLRNEGIDKDSIWTIINSIDLKNETRLKEIVLEYGYPDERIIGGYKIDNQPVNPGIMLFHFEDYDFWTTTLKPLIDKGLAPPSSLGNFVDSYQRRVAARKKFIYGIYQNINPDEIIDYNQLDERRVSIGLAPLSLKKRIDSLKRAHYGY